MGQNEQSCISFLKHKILFRFVLLVSKILILGLLCYRERTKPTSQQKKCRTLQCNNSISSISSLKKKCSAIHCAGQIIHIFETSFKSSGKHLMSAKCLHLSLIQLKSSARFICK